MTPKNALGSKSDVAWKHCISIVGDTRKLHLDVGACKYCQKVLIGGLYRLKHHLDVGACKDAHDEVKK